MKRSKGKTQVRLSRAKRAGRPPLSLANPPTGFTMSVADLAEIGDMSRNQAYDEVNRGTYPSIRGEKKGSVVRVLTVPTLAILRGEMQPGPPKSPHPTTPNRHKPAAAAAREVTP